MNTLDHSEIHFTPFSKVVIVKKCPLHNHKFFEFTINLEGEYENNINGVAYKITKGTVILLRPEDQHRFLCEGSHTHRDVYVSVENMKTIAACIDKELYNELASTPLAVKFQLSHYQLELLESKLNLFNNTASSSELFLNLVHTNIVTEILLLWKQNSNNNITLFPSWLSTLLHQLESETYFLKSVDEIIDNINYSHGYVCRQFKKYMNITLKDYMSNKKFDYAITLLQHKEAQISDIAKKLNYYSIQNFIIAFKKKYGLSPSQFRKQKYNISNKNEKL